MDAEEATAKLTEPVQSIAEAASTKNAPAVKDPPAVVQVEDTSLAVSNTCTFGEVEYETVEPVMKKSLKLHLNNEGLEREEEVRDRRSREQAPAADPGVLAEVATVSVVADTVRLRTPASRPFQVSGEATVEMGGSHCVEPEAIMRLLILDVLTGTLV